MITLVELLKLHNVTDQEINDFVIMSHTEKQTTKKSVGKSITAYDLWRSDYDNRKQDELTRDLVSQSTVKVQDTIYDSNNDVVFEGEFEWDGNTSIDKSKTAINSLLVSNQNVLPNSSDTI